MKFFTLFVKISLYFSLLVTNALSAQKYDLVIKNGRVIDGSGNPWFAADVAIKAGKIAGIGFFQVSEGAKVIDAKNQIICPGFIDVHTHVEEALQKLPTADNFIYDGIYYY